MTTRPHTRRALAITAAVCILGSATASTSESDSSTSTAGHWVGTWGAPPTAAGSAFNPPRTFENQTLRHVVHVSVGGRRVRVRLSNAFGTAPLHIGAAHVALHAAGASIVPGSDRPLTFSGHPSITIPTGAVALSDPATLDVPVQGDLAVSVYVPDKTSPATNHESSDQTSYISTPGDFSGAVDLPVAETTLSRFWLSVVEVSPRERVGAIVTLGDSITEGNRSTVDANHRWPDLLSARLNPLHGRPRAAVVNQGIGCSRLLHDFCGPSGASRFDRDVLAVTGATHVIVDLGLNDFALPSVAAALDLEDIFPAAKGVSSQIVSAEEVITGLRQLIARGHAAGLLVYGATITPVGRSVVPGFFTPENEAKRQALNRWIRTSGAFDAVIDFDAAVRDPEDPTLLLAAFASDDGIHPNDAGYAAMANAVDLSLFR
jgi:lysophospholipase L1-like esterase